MGKANCLKTTTPHSLIGPGWGSSVVWTLSNHLSPPSRTRSGAQPESTGRSGNVALDVSTSFAFSIAKTKENKQNTTKPKLRDNFVGNRIPQNSPLWRQLIERLHYMGQCNLHSWIDFSITIKDREASESVAWGEWSLHHNKCRNCSLLAWASSPEKHTGICA